jgi:glycosyltransferase involved in cell wall biosynthesis
MRIAIASVQVPFITGGAQLLTRGLLEACRAAGHETEVVTAPFRFFPDHAVRRSMDNWEAEDFEQLNGYTPDLVLCVQFPAYYLRHPRKVVWLIHQHRSVYDLWDPAAPHEPETLLLRECIVEKDTLHLKEASGVFTIAQNVSARLKRYNGIGSRALYHPPRLADRLYSRPAEPYIFFPSRLETLKRQSLLIRAMQYVESGVAAIIGGVGGQMPQYQRLIEELGLGQRVRLVGSLSEEELLAYYACCLGVFFGPQDEDYGLVTLEAMLARKPVITCRDSGGPLEFVRHDETGFVVEPEPKEIARSIDLLSRNPSHAADLGSAGYLRYQAMNISWENVIANLLQ